ncbi:MAG: low temperature requirement protein A [Nocardioides sp.]
MNVTTVPLLRRVAARDPHEPGRTATPLELLFDLVFVVAIASNAAQLHHAISEHHVMDGIVGYSMSWFAIWWAWMGFTWFASAYDNDDPLYRVLAFVIMTGSLMLAAAIPDLFVDGQSVLAVVGYAVMRLGLVALWLRVATGDPERRALALRYAMGITAVQALWIVRLWFPSEWWVPTFFLFVACELSVPIWAEGKQGTSPWHRHHIAERFSLLTIIVLGEVILSSVMAVQSADVAGWDFLPLVLGGLFLVYGLWWIYFNLAHHELTDGGAVTWVFAYGHLIIFASIAALGAGLAASVDALQGDGHHSDGPAATWVMAVGLALTALTLAGIHAFAGRNLSILVSPLLVAGAALVVGFIGLPVEWASLAMGLVVVAAVADHVLRRDRVVVAAPLG